MNTQGEDGLLENNTGINPVKAVAAPIHVTVGVGNFRAKYTALAKRERVFDTKLMGPAGAFQIIFQVNFLLSMVYDINMGYLIPLTMRLTAVTTN